MSEIHNIIFWSNWKPSGVVAPIGGHLKVREVWEIEWPNHTTSLSRFYQQNDISRKERKAGSGPFRLAIVEDPTPMYGERKTTRGVRIVNTNLFDYKQHLRKQGIPDSVHASDTPSESRRDLFMIFGEHRELAPRWDTSVERMIRDLSGHNGWKSLDQMFEAFNLTSKYLILRNHEGLPAIPSDGDIDFLVQDLKTSQLLLNGTQLRPQDPHRYWFKVGVGDTSVMVDLRYVGDGYFDTQWQKDVLKRRVLNPRGFYQMSEDDYYWTLLYHGLAHKPSLKEEYQHRLYDMKPYVHPDVNSLTDYMKRKGYLPTQPLDRTVPLKGVVRAQF